MPCPQLEGSVVGLCSVTSTVPEGTYGHSSLLECERESNQVRCAGRGARQTTFWVASSSTCEIIVRIDSRQRRNEKKSSSWYAILKAYFNNIKKRMLFFFVSLYDAGLSIATSVWTWGTLIIEHFEFSNCRRWPKCASGKKNCVARDMGFYFLLH